jgi:hypothetical protein
LRFLHAWRSPFGRLRFAPRPERNAFAIIVANPLFFDTELREPEMPESRREHRCLD